MAADSDGKSDWQFEWEAKQRKEYLEDPAMWLMKQVRWIGNRLDQETDWQVNETKSFIQNAAEIHEKELVNVRDSLIWWVSVIAMAALASAGIWIGVAAVGVLAALKAWFNWSARKQENHLEHFRDRFRDLLKRTNEGEALAEDKEFLRKHADSILFPLAVANTDANSVMSRFSKDAAYVGHGRETTNAHDLEHVETLYREYCDPNSMWGPRAGDSGPHCELSRAAIRVREHVEGVLSNFEAEIKARREKIVSRIDGNSPEGAIQTSEFIEDFRAWHGPLGAEAEMRALLQWLRDQDSWAFDHADKVRELCRPYGERQNESVARVFEKVSGKMVNAAARCGLADEWRQYDYSRIALDEIEEPIKGIRQIIGRHEPEAMFRELAEAGEQFHFSENGAMGRLKNYGYDANVVRKERRTAKKFIAKQRGEWAKCYEKELAAARSSLCVVRFVREQRYKEFNAAVDKDFRREEKPPLSSRMRRAFAGWLRL